MIRNTLLGATALVLIAAAPLAASAADLSTETPIEDSSMFDVAFGVTLASDYVWRGISQTNSSGAIQGYMEATYGIFYAGVWASNVDYGAGAPDTEVDLYFGVAPTFWGIDFDINAYYFAYPRYTGSWNFWELGASASYAFTDWLTLSITGNYVPDQDNVFENGHLALGAEIALPYDVTFSAALGTVESFGSGANEWTYWNAGLSYSLNDYVSLDLRYWDTDIGEAACGGSECAPRIVGSVTIETSWSALSQ